MHHGHSLEVVNKPCHFGTENHGLLTLPNGLEVCKSKIPGAGMGVKAKRFFKNGTRFGPYDGSKVLPEELKDPSIDTSYMWEIMKGKKVIHYINGKDMRYGNWLRYINCSRIEEEQNLVAFQHKSQIYHRAYKDINVGDELLVWYGNEYAKELGILDDVTDGFDDEEDSFDICDQGPVFECNLCHKCFSDKKHMLRHMEACITNKIKSLSTEQSKSQLARLQLCRKRPTLFNDGDDGVAKPFLMKQQQQQQNQFKCKECGRMFTTDLALQSHNCTLLSSTSSSSIQCWVCGLKFDQSSHLDFHLTVHKEQERRYQETSNKCYTCYRCDRHFPTLAHLKMHQTLHDMTIQCERCLLHFKSQEMLNQHHCVLLDPQHQCHRGCGSGFGSFVELQQHLQTHNEDNIKLNAKMEVLICYLCGHHAFTKFEMRYHFRTHLKRHKCEVCGICFPKLQELKIHSEIHNTTRFTCKKCGKTLDSEPAFMIHSQLHANEEAFKYVCSVCGKRFHVLLNLEVHLRVHAGEKLYKCDVCGQGFDRNHFLREHVTRKHTKTSLHSCKTCGKGYKLRHYLKKHEKIHCCVCTVCKRSIKHDEILSHMKRHTKQCQVIIESL